MDTHYPLAQEWRTLQSHHEQHERNALVIKLVCVSLSLIGVASHVPPAWLALTTALLWALMLVKPPAGAPMQLHTEWAARRPGASGLVASYALSALKPTVAFPYVPLVLAMAIHAT